MKNFFLLAVIVLIIGFSIFKGVTLSKLHPPDVPKDVHPPVPYLGRIQVLNGCGTEGVAHLMANHLRKNHFDVKDISNAGNWNYPETLVLSRINDTTIASQVAETLHTKNMILLKNQEDLYDVTVIVGPDYRERIR